MKKWRLKAWLQKGISFLPWPHRVNYIFQKQFTFRNGFSPGYYMPRLKHLRTHLHAIEKFGSTSASSRILEIGTGWHPLIPVGFYVAGYNDITTADIRPLFNRYTLKQTLNAFCTLHENNQLRQFISDPKPERLQHISSVLQNIHKMSPTAILGELKIKHVATRDAALPFGNNCFHVLVSNNTLEEIPVADLQQLMQEMIRVATQGSVFSHFIDMSDSFAHFDHSISPLNYLQFSEKEWQHITNKLVHQNRMRIPFYRQLFNDNGLQIVEELHTSAKEEALAAIKLHSDFEPLSVADILIAHSHLVAVKR